MIAQGSKQPVGSAKTSVSEKTVGIVDRAAAILEAFDRVSSILSLPELSDRVSLPKPTCFRIAAVLVRLGWLEQNQASGLYSLGLASLKYSEALLASYKIRGLARPVMQGLRDELNETVILSVCDGDFRYNIDSVESAQMIGQTQQIGVPIPLYAGAASRVFLAALKADDLQAYFSRTKLTPFSGLTLTDAEALQREIARIRRIGYAKSAGEFTPGTHAIAALITRPHPADLAALHVSIPAARYSPSLERQCAASLQAAVQQISASDPTE